MWGLIPAAGRESRLQPLAFPRELLPIGSRHERGAERPRAASEHLVDRLLLAGATRVCFVISSGSSDLVEYYGATLGQASLSYVVQPRPAGLCDAVFRALPLIPPEDLVFVGLPDAIWFPEDGLSALRAQPLSFLLFPVDHPERFDAVVTDSGGRVVEIQARRRDAASRWVWGAFKLTGAVLQELHELWCERSRRDEHIGPLVNEYIARGGVALGVRAGHAYAEVGTLDGYREALRLLSSRTSPQAAGDGERHEPSGSPAQLRAAGDGERHEPPGSPAQLRAAEDGERHEPPGSPAQLRAAGGEAP
ncbi:sugar phosphate nucleotidyltransferase [Sorangium sp. So ce1078]|uniref:sugar phosphate nucleotidyltransferase n=1 Tax=Sorangium sp. So ce1078 TaxID=3133329 RepID=UPI003F5E0DE2